MTRRLANRRWTAEDLTDPTRPDVEEDDPWAVTLPKADSKEYPAAHIPPSTGNDQPEATRMADFGDADLSNIDEWCDDCLPPLDLDDEIIAEDWDEPEPLAEADSDLKEPLYSSDNTVTGRSHVFKIDELISRVKPMSETQRQEIDALLKDFSIKRLRRWLPWLRKRDWSGRSLLLFLQFRKVWESERRYWEYSFWHRGLKCWYPTYHPNNLNRDATYKLIQNRLDCTPEAVINEDWFEEWKYSALWARGFPSFASFAVLRAEFDEKWRDHVDSDLDNERSAVPPPITRREAASLLGILFDQTIDILVEANADNNILPNMELIGVEVDNDPITWTDGLVDVVSAEEDDDSEIASDVWFTRTDTHYIRNVVINGERDTEAFPIGNIPGEPWVLPEMPMHIPKEGKHPQRWVWFEETDNFYIRHTDTGFSHNTKRFVKANGDVPLLTAERWELEYADKHREISERFPKSWRPHGKNWTLWLPYRVALQRERFQQGQGPMTEARLDRMKYEQSDLISDYTAELKKVKEILGFVPEHYQAINDELKVELNKTRDWLETVSEEVDHQENIRVELERHEQRMRRAMRTCYECFHSKGTMSDEMFFIGQRQVEKIYPVVMALYDKLQKTVSAKRQWKAKRDDCTQLLAFLAYWRALREGREFWDIYNDPEIMPIREYIE